jgi:hexosaminidase
MLACAGLLLLLASQACAIWPQPTTVHSGKTVLAVSNALSVETSKVNRLSRLPDLRAAILETLSRIRKDKLQILELDRGLHYSARVKSAPSVQRLFLLPSKACTKTFTDISAQITLPLEDRDESYSLTVSARGIATLSACNALGMFRGLHTFEQLIYTLPTSGLRYIPNAPISIHDSPAFAYRGVMLDTARNFFPVESILKTLQTMSYAKLSAFHW